MVIHTPFAENRPYLDSLEQQFKLAEWFSRHQGFRLVYDELGLQLFKQDEPKLGAVRVDFVTGASAHRRKYGGGKGEAIAKAVGMNKGAVPKVLDATAGLGRDAFVLAALGCEVLLHERHPVVAALLFDGLQRAYLDVEIGPWMQQHMQMVFGSSHDLLSQSEFTPDVVYLDPMFPHREKSALVKKEMRVFQSLVGGDDDADALLPFALTLASKRVVVKRPDYAPFLALQKPSMQIETKKNRFDVYVKAAML
ncbi:class I SAM-dependent methyltransferase [Pseudoalteromonas fenneropenaei]|uniref:Ribosomal RNA small subunit methyltransferase J n=1 Tax=Pseudoalteromonas fenneropenaei TaxID=1737459 RepID=A0ABV7CNY0_9GAMM